LRLSSNCAATIEAVTYTKTCMAISVADLRMEVRSSLYTKELAGHKHEYGDETYNSTDDTYSKACTTCDHKITYEKM